MLPSSTICIFFALIAIANIRSSSAQSPLSFAQAGQTVFGLSGLQAAGSGITGGGSVAPGVGPALSGFGTGLTGAGPGLTGAGSRLSRPGGLALGMAREAALMNGGNLNRNLAAAELATGVRPGGIAGEPLELGGRVPVSGAAQGFPGLPPAGSNGNGTGWMGAQLNGPATAATVAPSAAAPAAATTTTEIPGYLVGQPYPFVLPPPAIPYFGSKWNGPWGYPIGHYQAFRGTGQYITHYNYYPLSYFGSLMAPFSYGLSGKK